MREYKVDVNGIEHTFQLDDEDAKARGLKVAEKSADAPANKARRASNKARS